MSEREIYDITVRCWAGLAAVAMPTLFLKAAPYGRHTPANARWTLPSRIGWILMEAPSAIVVAICMLAAPRPVGVVPLMLFVLWELHYLNRSFVYPFRMRGGGRPMPISICASAFSFTTINGYLNGRWIATFGVYPDAWATDPRFVIGVALFAIGFAINQHSDALLFRLRGRDDTGYKIPSGGLFRYVSCPNYLGEIIEWCGWALATWSVAGLAFAVWTVANLAPRARAHHRWYRATFATYPANRRALVPGVY
jgi:protein-S-isoprenylcysteine O-methyltransferase Ste14